MKMKMIIPLYLGFLACIILLNSCQDDPIVPNDPSDPNVDTTWVDDSTNWNPYDTLGGGGYDSTGWNDPTGGGGNPNDSTGWNPNDSLGG
jgi:hypothetical protein